MKRIVLIAVVLAGLGLLLGGARAGSAPQTVTLKARFGDVTFDHAGHSKTIACKECHHKDEPGKEQACGACHQKAASEQVCSRKTAFHKNCKGCHKAQQKGPVGCRDCHVKK